MVIKAGASYLCNETLTPAAGLPNAESRTANVNVAVWGLKVDFVELSYTHFLPWQVIGDFDMFNSARKEQPVFSVKGSQGLRLFLPRDTGVVRKATPPKTPLPYSAGRCLGMCTH